MTVTIKVDDSEVLAALQRLIDKGRDPAPMLSAIGLILAASTRERIKDEKSPDGTPFAPLNPLYKKGKKGPGILRESQTLFRTIVSQVEGNSVFVGTNRPHARVHQFGATIRPKTAAALVFQMAGQTICRGSVIIPPRPFLGISKQDREDIVELIEDEIAGAIDGA
jgi:phage virion morphogenesis protein